MHSRTNKPSGRLKRSLQENQAKAEAGMCARKWSVALFHPSSSTSPLVSLLCVPRRFCVPYYRQFSYRTFKDPPKCSPRQCELARLSPLSPSYVFVLVLRSLFEKRQRAPFSAAKIWWIDIYGLVTLLNAFPFPWLLLLSAMRTRAAWRRVYFILLP